MLRWTLMLLTGILVLMLMTDADVAPWELGVRAEDLACESYEALTSALCCSMRAVTTLSWRGEHRNVLD